MLPSCCSAISVADNGAVVVVLLAGFSMFSVIFGNADVTSSLARH
jgi:hypothetical protein